MTSEDILVTVFIICVLILFSLGFYLDTRSKIEHEKTIQKAIECGYQPLCIGGYYWNKGD